MILWYLSLDHEHLRNWEITRQDLDKTINFDKKSLAVHLHLKIGTVLGTEDSRAEQMTSVPIDHHCY